MLTTSDSHEKVATPEEVSSDSSRRYHRVGLTNTGSALKIFNPEKGNYRLITIRRLHALNYALQQLDTPLVKLNTRQAELVGVVVMHKYNAEFDRQIIKSLMKTDESSEFSKSKIAEKINLLKKFIRENFANGDRYSGENLKTFEKFKILSDEKRKQVIDGLNSKLTK
jgi:hypothetical protein